MIAGRIYPADDVGDLFFMPLDGFADSKNQLCYDKELFDFVKYARETELDRPHGVFLQRRRDITRNLYKEVCDLTVDCREKDREIKRLKGLLNTRSQSAEEAQKEIKRLKKVIDTIVERET